MTRGSRVLWAFILTSLVIVLTLQVTLSFEAGRQREIITDCITPGGRCYKEQQQRTAELIDQLYEQGIDRERVTRQMVVDSATAVATCSGLPTAPERLQCVNRLLQQETR